MQPSEARVVLITGASSGIGAAVARSCAAAGFRVALAARRVERLEQLASELGRPDSVLLIRADMRQPDDVARMVRETESRFGRIDVLLANAGVGHGIPFVQTTDDQLLDQIEVNLLAVMRAAQAVLPGMLARRSGHILSIASVASEIPSPAGVVYAASKGGVLAFSEGLRRELRGTGVHVSVIQPGFIRTEMTARVNIPMPPPSLIGDLVLDLLRRPRRRAVLPRFYGAGIWLNRFAPGIIDWMIDRMQNDARFKWEQDR
jgi:short-subunit dehydrogenase